MRVLFVSKPVSPPFHDGSTCLVRAVARNLKSHRATVLVAVGDPPWRESNVEQRPVYAAPSPLTGSQLNNARAFFHLATDKTAHLWHFVFAPNPRTSRAIRALRRFRHVPVVQTIASPPRDFEQLDGLLFGDVVVAQSEWTRQQLARAGFERNVEVIAPALGDIEPPSEQARAEVRARLQIEPGARVVVYPGDLEFSAGARRTAEIVDALAARGYEGVVVFACRRKTERALTVEAELVARLDSRRVRFAGELPSLLPLLATADVVAFPVEDLWAKVDIPIAILEAMALDTPVIVAARGPLVDVSTAMQLDPDEPSAWADGIVTLLENDTRRSDQIVAQRQLLEQRFSAARVAGEYERLYASMLRGQARVS